MMNFRVAPLMLIALIFLSVAIVNQQITITIWRHSFDDGSYSHAYLIPFIVAFMFWQLQKRGELISRQALSLPACVIFIGVGILLFISVRAQLSLGYWLSMLLLCVSGIMLFFRCNIATLATSFYPIYLLPVWGGFTDILQSISVVATGVLLSFSGIPFFIEQELVTIPAGIFKIANGCSGLRYLLVSLALAHLYILLYLRHWQSAVKFLAVAIAGALLTNWIRITALILVGEYTQMTSDLIDDHNNFGWYLYIPFLFILFKYGTHLENAIAKKQSQEQSQQDEEANSSKPVASVSLPTVSVFIIGLFLSSSFLATVHKSTQVLTQIETLPSPQISYFSSIDVKQSETDIQKTIEYRIWFDCKELDCKPDFYLNKIIPEGWHVVRRYQNEQGNQVIVRRGSDEAKITYRYQLHDAQFTSSLALKLARLKHFMTTDSRSSIHWQMSRCKTTQCLEQEKIANEATM
ncbi:exosortase [Thalassotalea sp. Y01]|uniref:exosortase n=1 Tax=Thalassotalea sp. Y01 TaxID=2729613 RepID=UPI00145C6197|nr:exosortase [Thalassotalea sp. Y01]NMP16180.1 exosortase [Thalassotalea sp. Y01]